MYCPNDDCPDFLKYGLRGEYRESFTNCPKCGAQLLPGSPSSDPGTPAPVEQNASGFSGPIVQVAAFLTQQEADLACSFLTSQGIDAMVSSDNCGGLRPELGFANNSRLLVPEHQADEAAQLLSEAVLEGDDSGA